MDSTFTCGSFGRRWGEMPLFACVGERCCLLPFAAVEGVFGSEMCGLVAHFSGFECGFGR